MKTIFLLAGAVVLASLVLAPHPALAQVPQLINYQGRVVVGAVNFDGTGQFKFALVNADGTITFWSNDGTSTMGGEPTGSVSLPVARGLYTVKLGDTALPNMTTIPATVFNNPDVRLRVWFNDGANGSQLLAPDQRIVAVGYAMMAAGVPDGAITGPKIAAGSVTNVQLAAGAAAANLGAAGQSGVATGGVILSQDPNSATLASAGYVQIGETMTVDYWKLRSIAVAPIARREHSAVWTGSEMIIWGGKDAATVALNTGARYNPVTDNWSTTNSGTAPIARSGHTAVWTGSEMIVWGGVDNASAATVTGARYSPVADTWTTLPLQAAIPRTLHTAVWTGSEMIIWGGTTAGINGTYTGSRYNPVSNSWQLVTNTSAPVVGNGGHTAIWTGTEMIVWGGQLGTGTYPSTGGRYDPLADSWLTVPSAIGGGRNGHSAIWTGTEMIIWGGQNQPGGVVTRLNTGIRYTPGGGWVATSVVNAPTARAQHTAVWTGQEMIVWGGTMDTTGGRYNPATSNSWGAMNTNNAPAPRSLHTATWTGSEMIIFGGQNTVGTNLTLNTPFGYTPPRTLYLYQRP